MSTLYEVFLRIRNLSGQICRENTTSQFIFNNLFLESRGVLEIRLKDTVERGRPQMIIRRMRCTCRISKYTDTHTRNMLYFFHGNKAYANAP